MTNTTIPYYESENVILASQIIGYLAGASVVTLNIPQIVAIIKNKSASDVSLLTILLNLLAGFLFLIYGILLFQFPLIINNGLYIIITLILLYCKIYFDKKKSKDDLSKTKNEE